MKKSIVLIVVLIASFALKAQTTNQGTSKETKSSYSFAWGLFKSKDYPKEKTATFQFEKPVFSTSFSTPLDTTKYEQKSMLWGAIQWVEKKKNVSSSK